MYNFAPKFVEIYNTGKVDLFGQELFDLSAQDGIGVTKGGMEVAVEGEDGRANINQVDSVQSKRALFQHLFGYLQGPRPAGVGLTDEDKARAELIFNIIDWVDEDEIRTEIDQKLQKVSAFLFLYWPRDNKQFYWPYRHQVMRRRGECTEITRVVCVGCLAVKLASVEDRAR